MLKERSTGKHEEISSREGINFGRNILCKGVSGGMVVKNA